MSLGDYLAKPFQRRIDAAREAEIAQLTKDSHQAQARIAEAQANMADAQAKAAEANRIAEEERLARIKIEQRLAPRTLTIEQQQRIVDKIKPFGRQDYSPGVTNQTEAIEFLRMMERILQVVGWHRNFIPIADINLGEASLINASGIEVQVAPKYLDDLRSVATALASALQGEGITTKLTAPLERDANPKVIYVLVGEKPR